MICPISAFMNLDRVVVLTSLYPCDPLTHMLEMLGRLLGD